LHFCPSRGLSCVISVWLSNAAISCATLKHSSCSIAFVWCSWVGWAKRKHHLDSGIPKHGCRRYQVNAVVCRRKTSKAADLSPRSLAEAGFRTHFCIIPETFREELRL
jgi:hypothetical protein